MTPPICRYPISAMFLFAGLALAQPAAALTFMVTRVDDPTPDGCQVGDCSLREAIIDANGNAGADDIDLPGGIYALTLPDAGGIDENASATGDLDITEDLDILPSGNVVIDATGLDQAFHVAAGKTLSAIPVEILAAEPVRFFGSFVSGGVALLSGSVEFLGQGLTGDFRYTQNATTSTETIAETANASFFFGESGGTPDETGFQSIDVSGVALVTPSGAAGTLQGTTALVGVSDLTLLGNPVLRVNQTAVAISATVATSGGPVNIELPPGPIARVEIIGGQLDIFGQPLQGDFVFEKSGTNLVALGIDAQYLMSTGGAAGLQMTGLQLGLLILPDGSYGITSTGLLTAVNIPDLILSGAFGLVVNSSSSSIQEAVSIAGVPFSFDLPAGPNIRISGAGVGVGLLGKAIFGDFAFEQAGSNIVAQGLDGVLSLETNGVAQIQMGDLTSSLLILPDGDIGLQGDGQLAPVNVPDLSFAGAFTVRANTSATSIQELVTIGGSLVNFDLPVGPFLSVQGISVQMDVLGQSVFGDILIEESGANVVASIVNSFVTLDTSGVAQLQLANLTASLLILPDGSLGLQGDGQLAPINIPDLSFVGAFTVSANNSATGIQESVSIGGSPVNFDLPGGPYLRVEGISAQMNILGESLFGDMAFEVSGPNVVGLVFNGFLSLDTSGSASLDMGSISSSLLILPDGGIGLVGSGPLVPTGIPDLSLAGAFELRANSSSNPISESVAVMGNQVEFDLIAGPYLRFEGVDVGLGIFGETLTGFFAFEKSGSNLVGFGSGGVFELGTSGDAALLMNDIAPSLLILPDGTFVLIADGPVSPVDIPDISLSGTFALQVSTTSVAISELITINGNLVEFNLAAGPFLRMEGVNSELHLSGVSLIGDLLLQSAGSNLTIVGESMISPVSSLESTSGSLGLLIAPEGKHALTAEFGGVALLDGPGFTFGGTAALRSNTTGLPVNETLATPGGFVELAFVDGQSLFEFLFDPPLTPAGFGGWLDAIAAAPSLSLTRTLDLRRALNPGTYTASRSADVPAGVRMVLDGNGGGASLVSSSPALTIASGEVKLANNLTLQGSSDAPVLRVDGGHLVIRDCTVQESASGDQVGVEVLSGSADLGTASDAGANLFTVSGEGHFIRNASSGYLLAIGNSYELDGQPVTDPFDIEKRIIDVLDTGTGGLVTVVANAVHKTVARNKVFEIDLNVLIADLELTNPSFDLAGSSNGSANLTVSPAEFTPSVDYLGDAGFAYDISERSTFVVHRNVNLRYAPTSPADFDLDFDVDADDFVLFGDCTSGPTIPFAPGCEDRDFDDDNDVDQTDFGFVQRCRSGPGVPGDLNCAD